MKTKVVVVDDDFSALKAIKNYCEQINLEVVAAFNSSKKFIDEFETLDFDLAILDYAMPQFDGLQVAALLNSENIPIIFVTGHRDNIAAKAWDLDCIACVEKPVSIEKLNKAIEKFQSKTQLEEKFIQFQIYGGKLVRFKISEIAHFGKCQDDNSGNDRTLTNMQGVEYRIVKVAIKELLELLPADKFIRTKKSDIVARHAILNINKTFKIITLKVGEKEVDVTDDYLENFKKWY
jgi:two-component system LytT family response regulator